MGMIGGRTRGTRTGGEGGTGGQEEQREGRTGKRKGHVEGCRNMLVEGCVTVCCQKSLESREDGCAT